MSYTPEEIGALRLGEARRLESIRTAWLQRHLAIRFSHRHDEPEFRPNLCYIVAELRSRSK